MRTKLFAAAAAIAAAMTCAPAFTAGAYADEPARNLADEGMAMGTIGAVDHAKSMFELVLADGQKLSVTFNDNTAFTVNGNAATKEVLKENAKAAVTHTKGVAKSVAITSE